MRDFAGLGDLCSAPIIKVQHAPKNTSWVDSLLSIKLEGPSSPVSLLANNTVEIEVIILGKIIQYT